MSRLAEFDQKWLESKGFSRPICQKARILQNGHVYDCFIEPQHHGNLGLLIDNLDDVCLELHHGDCVSVGSAVLWFVKLSVVDLPVLAVHVDQVQIETCQQPTRLILVLPSLTNLIPFVIVPMCHSNMQCQVQTNRGSVWVSVGVQVAWAYESCQSLPINTATWVPIIIIWYWHWSWSSYLCLAECQVMIETQVPWWWLQWHDRCWRLPWLTLTLVRWPK